MKTLIAAASILASTTASHAVLIGFETFSPERIEFWIYNGLDMADGMTPWVGDVGDGHFTVTSIGSGTFVLEADVPLYAFNASVTMHFPFGQWDNEPPSGTAGYPRAEMTAGVPWTSYRWFSDTPVSTTDNASTVAALGFGLLGLGLFRKSLTT